MVDPNTDKIKSGSAETASIKRLIRLGVIAMVVLIGGVGGWAAFTEISGAIIAPGHLKVEGNAKLVQHAEGGIVGNIQVKEGDVVKGGDVLVTLDAAETEAQLAMVRGRSLELSFRRARLIAERDNQSDIRNIPEVQSLLQRGSEAEAFLKVQQKLLANRRTSQQSKLNQVAQHKEQLNQHIEELAKQTQTKNKEISVLKEDLKRLNILDKKRLTSKQRVSEAQRLLSRAQGDLSRILSSVSRAKSEILQMSLKAEEIKSDYSSDVLKELNQVQLELAQLVEQERAASDRMKRIEIRAPLSGRVHELSVHTKGGVIAAGTTIMQIVPVNEGLVIEAKAAAQDIDQIRQGMRANIRFTAFSSRTTPELNGTAVTVSPDRSIDEQTGQPYYTVVVRVDEGEKAKLNGQQLVPGMPAEVLLKTEPRTVLSYLTKPITDQFRRAFREE